MSGDVEDPPRFGPAHKRASELSDAELQAELERRRAVAVASTAPAGSALSARQSAQYLANLELPANAGPADVAAAYDRLAARYAAGRSSDDAGKRSASEQLLSSLTEARDALLAHFRR